MLCKEIVNLYIVAAGLVSLRAENISSSNKPTEAPATQVYSAAVTRDQVN
jgi:hypothetical protein